MAGLTDFASAEYLNYVTGQLVTPALPAIWMGLFTTAPTSDSGVTGATEVSGGSYARVQIAGTAAVNALTASGNPTLHFASTPTWIVAGMSIRDVTTPSAISAATTVLSTTGTTVVMSANAAGGGVVNADSICFSAFAPPIASSGAEPATISGFSQNTNTSFSFVQSTASWGTVLAFGLFDAVTAGNLRWWDFLGNFAWKPFTATSATPGILTSTAHGYSNSDPVVVTAKFDGTTLPTTGGSWAGALTVADVTTDTFTAGVNTTSTGAGMVRKILQQSVPINITVTFGTSSLTLSLA